MEKAKFTYLKWRGKGEVIRLALAAANIEFEEELVLEPEQLDKLRQAGSLKFQQLPFLEINGLKLVQSMATVRYIANKYGMTGTTHEQNAEIDMLVDGARDLYSECGFNSAIFTPDPEQTKTEALAISKTRYFPVFEKALAENGGGFLVGDKVSMADVVFLDVLLWVQECDETFLKDFPLVKGFLAKMTALPGLKAYLEGPKRLPQPTKENDEAYVRKVLNFYD